MQSKGPGYYKKDRLQGQEGGGSVGKRDASMSGATVLEDQKQDEDAHRSGQDVRQGGALKPIWGIHMLAHMCESQSDRPSISLVRAKEICTSCR